MINRIRDIRQQKGMTLADVAAACSPPTTAQTIGRLETGMRNLSLVWMNRIAAALDVDSELLVRSEGREPVKVVAVLTDSGAEALRQPREVLLPGELAVDAAWIVLDVEHSSGEYRAGDQVWLRQQSVDIAPRFLNRDVLVPRPAGRFAFGRLFDCTDARVALLPPANGRRQILVEHPQWIAVAEMLVRKL